MQYKGSHHLCSVQDLLICSVSGAHVTVTIRRGPWADSCLGPLPEPSSAPLIIS